MLMFTARDLNDCHHSTLQTPLDVVRLFESLMDREESMLVLTPDGKAWEVYIDRDEDDPTLGEIDGWFSHRQALNRAEDAFAPLKGGWVVARRTSP